MKMLLIASWLVLIFFDSRSQPDTQKVFMDFVALYNQGNFDAIYNGFSQRFKLQVDQAVVTGGLQHVFETNGVISAAVIEWQSNDEGSYVAIAHIGIFRVSLAIDEMQRIDGLKIKKVASAPPQSPTLVFNDVGKEYR